jgi:alpha-L-arabinofuranosidase
MSRVKSLRIAWAASMLFVFAAAGAIAAEPIAIVVHADRPGVKISPTLYGIFFEEVNRAGDGGLYGEMIQNRSFEDDRGPDNREPKKIPAWTLVRSTGAEATIALDASRPIHRRNPHALRLEITKTGGGRAGVANEGFRGIALRKGGRYALSLYARGGDGFHGPLGVSLEDKDGKVLAAAKIETVAADWQKFERVLTADGTTASTRLVVAASSPGTVWLDMVSLFPQATWKGRTNGLRPDLAAMLADMQPAFVRFPGGCYVEGDRLANAFRWKKSIGDPAERPGHWNLWGYRSCDGLGYHEYLQMCEDLGAEPLLVINCGMSHQQQGEQAKTKKAVAVPDLPEYVADALDAIEYANGPADSRWGALRAKAGHAAAFHLQYLEIGNENSGPTYDKHYRAFYEAIKAKYPEMHLVADTMTRPGPVEIVDEHYYSTPEFFISRATQYDKYDRKGPKVYVGEYAVTQHCGRGNLRAALAEAAFMTGLERNADVVVMASYAPLFVNPGWRVWNPNAIIFDNARVCGTPSYYVQKMFSRARGDAVLAMDFESSRLAGPRHDATNGANRLDAPAGLKDLKSMYAVASRASRSNDVILKVVNLGKDARATRIELAGLAGKVKSATATVLTSATPDDENSLGEPAKVVPVTRPIAAGAQVAATLPPHSVTVLRWSVEE